MINSFWSNPLFKSAFGGSGLVAGGAVGFEKTALPETVYYTDGYDSTSLLGI